MLKLEGIHEQVNETIQVDEYIPIKVTWSTYQKNPRLFWRTGNLKTSLLEIGIDSVTGIMRSVTLTFTDNMIITKEEAESWIAIDGTPVFYRNDWGSQYYLDEPHPFNCYLTDDRLSINLKDDVIVSKVIRSGRVLFYLDAHEVLCKIDFTKLTASESDCIRLHLPRS